MLIARGTSLSVSDPRAHFAEFGIVAPLGGKGIEQLLAIVANAKDRIGRACAAAMGAATARDGARSAASKCYGLVASNPERFKGHEARQQTRLNPDC
jgi:hypothetical protein